MSTEKINDHASYNWFISTPKYKGTVADLYAFFNGKNFILPRHNNGESAHHYLCRILQYNSLHNPIFGGSQQNE